MNDFPLLLAGPILRRVEPGLVSVWVATREACTVKVEVYLGLKRAADVASGRLVAKTEAPTIRIGEQLHIVVVAARPEANAGLMPEQTYSYNVTLFGSFGTKDLDGLHLLEECRIANDGSIETDKKKPAKANLPLGYQPGFLPSFELPPLQLTDLRLVHGSCRRANREGPDGLAWVDDLINDGLVKSALGDPKKEKKRPHQLLLTGDQIYADDVAPPMLDMLNLATKFLIGGKRDAFEELTPIEKLPVAGNLWPADVVHFPVGYRKTLVLDEARMTSHDGGSHLFSLGEFCAMYLFAWSNACWPHAMHPVDAFLPVMPSELLIPSELKRPHVFTSDEDFLQPGDTKEVAKLRKSLVADHRALKELYRILPKVRRALANVPTYMMFDDHEVTDDWNLNPLWRDRVFTSPLGKTILRNGLVSYALFQGWGNDPVRFQKADPDKNAGLLFGLDTRHESELDKGTITDEVRLAFAIHQFALSKVTPDDKSLTTVSKKGADWVIEDKGNHREFIIRKKDEGKTVDGRKVEELKVFGNLPNALLLEEATKLFPEGVTSGPDLDVAERIDTLLGLDGKDPPVRWHYSYKGPKHLLLAIDNRTRRSFVSRLGPPGNVSAEALKEQIPDGPLPAGIEVAIVVAPLPVLGPPILDELLAPLIYRTFDLKHIKSDSDLAKHEGTRGMPGTNPDAIEAWAFDPKSFEGLLARLAAYRRVVILSGDVHYASSQAMSYWRDFVGSAPGELAAELDKGHLPEGIRQSLRQNGSALSEKATLEVQIAGNQWLITDEIAEAQPEPEPEPPKPREPKPVAKFLISKSDDSLSIYRVDNPPARFAQFTSSGMRNLMPPYIRQADRSLAFGQRLIRAKIGMERLGWDKNSPDPLKFPEGAEVVPVLRERLKRSPVMIPTEGFPEKTMINPDHPPDWSWRVEVLRDERPDGERPKPARPEPLDKANPADDITANVEGYRRVVVRQALQLERLNNSRQILFASSNLGVVRFDARPDASSQTLDEGRTVLHAIHEIYSVHEDADDPDKPELYTLHVTPLERPTDVKPQAKFILGGGP